MTSSSTLWFKLILKILLGIISSVALFCILWFPITWPLLLMWLTACSTTQDTTFNLSGFDIHITETLCSTIAKDAAVRVFISKTGERKQDLLFRYSPTDYLPTVRFSDPHTLLVSVPEVSSINFRRYAWNGLLIEYDIGIIIYHNPHEVQEHQ